MASPAEPSRRDRLLAALLADGDAVLLRCDEETAQIIRPADPHRIVLLTAPPGAIADGLAPVIASIVKPIQPGSPETHVVVIGGGPDIQSALERAAPRVQPVRMGFHHIDAAGEYRHVKGSKLAALERAYERHRETAPLTPEQLAEALSAGDALEQRAQAVAKNLTGRSRVTVAILAACVVLFGLGKLWGGDSFNMALWRMGADSGIAVRQGEIWRLFASAFLHGDFIHLGVNMLALWSLGPMLEALLGPRRYLVLYGGSALGGALASALLAPDRWSVGASGAIWGLMAAGIAVAMRPRGLLPPMVVASMRGRVWMPLIVNLAYSLRPGVDMLAHLGGGVVGFGLVATVLTRGVRPVDQRERPEDVELDKSPVAAIAAIAVSAAMALSVVVALAMGRPWTAGAPPALRRTSVGSTGVSAELPDVVADKVQVEEHSGVRIFTYGRIPDSPVAFDIIVAPLPGDLPPDEVDAFFEHERKAADEGGPPKAVRKAPAKRVTVGTRSAVLVEHAIEKVQLRSYLLVSGRNEVIVRGYSLAERPASWSGIEEKVAASVNPY